MNKEVKELLISQSFDNSSLKLNRFIVIYDNGIASILNQKGAELIIREMYNSGLSRKEVFAKIHFLSDEEFDKYYDSLDIITLRDRSKNKYRFKSTRKENLELDIAKYYNNPMQYSDDIDLGLSISDLKDPDKIYDKMTYLNRIKIKALAISMTAVVVVGGSYLLLRKNNTTNIQPVETRKSVENTTKSPELVISKGSTFNDLVNEYADGFPKQKYFIADINMFLNTYNRIFGKKHSSSGVRPGLSWDEMVALKLVYNNYNAEEIKLIFNGYKLDENKIKNDYKNATDQLEKAYVLENKKSNMGIDNLIDSSESRNIYDKINMLFMVAKESKGKKQIRAIDELYNNIYAHLYYNNIQGLDLALEPLVKTANRLFDGYSKNNNRQEYVYRYYNNDLYSTFSDTILEYAALAANGNKSRGLLYKDYKNNKEKELSNKKHYKLKNRKIYKLKEYKKTISKFDNKFPNDKIKIKKSTYQYTK